MTYSQLLGSLKIPLFVILIKLTFDTCCSIHLHTLRNPNIKKKDKQKFKSSNFSELQLQDQHAVLPEILSGKSNEMISLLGFPRNYLCQMALKHLRGNSLETCFDDTV